MPIRFKLYQKNNDSEQKYRFGKVFFREPMALSFQKAYQSPLVNAQQGAIGAGHFFPKRISLRVGWRACVSSAFRTFDPYRLRTSVRLLSKSLRRIGQPGVDPSAGARLKAGRGAYRVRPPKLHIVIVCLLCLSCCTDNRIRLADRTSQQHQVDRTSQQHQVVIEKVYIYCKLKEFEIWYEAKHGTKNISNKKIGPGSSTR